MKNTSKNEVRKNYFLIRRIQHYVEHLLSNWYDLLKLYINQH